MGVSQFTARQSRPLLVYVFPAVVAILGLSLFAPQLYSASPIAKKYLTALIPLTFFSSLIIGSIFRSDASPGSFILLMRQMEDSDTVNDRGWAIRIRTSAGKLVNGFRRIEPSLSEDIKKGMIKSLKDDFSLSKEHSDYDETYRLLRAKMDSKLSSEAFRLETMYLAVEGLTLVLIWLTLIYITTGILGISGLLALYGENSIWPILLSLVGLFTTLPSAVLFLGVMDSYQRRFTEQLLIEYYLSKIDEGDASGMRVNGRRTPRLQP